MLITKLDHPALAAEFQGLLIDSLRAALGREQMVFDKGFREGESKQAILEIRGRDKFLEDIELRREDVAKMKAERDAALSRAESAERQLCRAREGLQRARGLNGTECIATGSGHLPIILEKRGNPVERCGRCLYCVIDAALSSSSPCRHESALAELRGKVEDVEGLAKVIKKYTNDGRLDIEWLTRHHISWEADFARALRDHLMGGKG
jgi:hypothetical protein